jgi:hypothetical protein
MATWLAGCDADHGETPVMACMIVPGRNWAYWYSLLFVGECTNNV